MRETYPENLLITLIVLLYLLLSVPLIPLLGLYYDEVMFANISLGDIDGSFVYSRLLGVPFMAMPYVGSLKGFLYYPLFHLFEPDVYLVRLPMVIIGALSLLIMFHIVKEISGAEVALLACFLCAADFSYISATTFNFGSVTVALFLRLASMYSFTKWIKSRDNTHLAVALFLCLAGVWDKLVFIWYVNGLILSSLLVYHQEIKRTLREKPPKRWLTYPIILLVVAAFLAAIYILCFRPPVLTNIAGNFLDLNYEQLHYKYVLLASTINGSAFHNWALTKNIVGSSLFAYYFLSILLLYVLLSYASKTPPSKEITLTAFILVFIILQIFITPNATGMHHVMSIYPLQFIVLSHMLFSCAKMVRAKIRQNTISLLMIILIVSPLALHVLEQINILSDFRKNASEGDVNPQWSPKISALADYVKSRPNQQFFEVDWGTHNQLLVLASKNGRINSRELLWLLNEEMSPEKKASFNREYMKPGAYYILHSNSTTNFMTARTNFLTIVQEYNHTLELAESINSTQGALYEVFKLEK